MAAWNQSQKIKLLRDDFQQITRTFYQRHCRFKLISFCFVCFRYISTHVGFCFRRELSKEKHIFRNGFAFWISNKRKYKSKSKQNKKPKSWFIEKPIELGVIQLADLHVSRSIEFQSSVVKHCRINHPLTSLLHILLNRLPAFGFQREIPFL